MKNKTLKKSLSVFLSVLMVLSCWVFAPHEHNHALAATDDIEKEVTGYVTVDPVIYVHGTSNVSSGYAYMMNGSFVADGTVAGEMTTQVSVSGKSLQTITVVETGKTLTTLSDSGKLYLQGDLGSQYESIGQTTTDRSATLKFTFTDGTYEYHKVSVLPNPVPQHSLVLAYHTANGIRVASLLLTAEGSTGQNGGLGGGDKYSLSGNFIKGWYVGNANYPTPYQPYNTSYWVDNSNDDHMSYVDGFTYKALSFDKIAGTYLADRATDSKLNLSVGFNRAHAEAASGAANNGHFIEDYYSSIDAIRGTYYLDISSDYHPGLTYDITSGKWSFKVLSGTTYVKTFPNASPINHNGAAITESNTSQTLTLDSGLTANGGSGVYDTNKQAIYHSTISGYQTTTGTVYGTVTMGAQHLNDKQARGHADLSYWIKVIDNTKLRTLYNTYVAEKLEGIAYADGWEEYTAALQNAELFLSANADSTVALVQSKTQDDLYNELETAHNNLVKKVFDISYESLFSFAGWATSDCASSCHNGTVTYDIKAGMVTTTSMTNVEGEKWIAQNGGDKAQATDCYTVYGTAGSYSVPVEGNKSYTLEFTTNTTNGQSYVFYYDANGDACSSKAHDSLGSTKGVHKATFTTPSDCKTVQFRFGSTGQYSHSITFSNIALYETERANLVDLANWTKRGYRTTFEYGDQIDYNSIVTPERKGYIFNGWIISGAENMTDIFGANAQYLNYYCKDGVMPVTFNRNISVYSDWTIRSYTVKFVYAADANGNQKTEVSKTYEYGEKIVKPGNTAIDYDETNHYIYSWKDVADTASENVTYTENKKTVAHIYKYTYKDDETHTATCDCGYSKELAHDKQREATCTEQAWCGTCIHAFGELAKHEPQVIPGYAASCVSSGLTDGSKCKNCGTKLSEQQNIPKLGHAYGAWIADENGTTHTRTCERDGCKTTTKDHTQTANHNPKEIDRKNANCTEDGYIEYECVDCKYTYRTTLTHSEHDWADATCTAPKTCKNCDATEGESLGHDWSSTTYAMDSDGKSGKHYIVCARENCEEKQLSDHTWDKGEITSTPSCTKEGVKTYTCTADGCGATYTENVKKADHSSKIIPAVAPTCTDKGWTSGLECSVCGYIISAPTEEKALGHNWSSVVYIKDTDGKDGRHYKACANAGCSEKQYSNHDWNDGVQTLPASCIKEGVKTYTCKADGCGATYTEPIEKSAHAEIDIPAVAATCNSTGLTAGKKCKDCGEITVAQTSTPINPNNHASAETYTENAKAATCYEEGYTGDVYHKCCNTLKTAGESIDKIAHTPAEAVEENRVEAKCTSAGSYDLVVYCSVEQCKAEISHTPKTIEALGHLWSDSYTSNGNGKDATHYRVCTRSDDCTEKDVSAHTWNAGYTTLPASYNNVGETTYTCTAKDCGATYTQEIPMLKDENAPTGTIGYGESTWDRLLEIITFGRYENNNVTVTVSATDSQSGIKSVEYYVSNEALTAEQLGEVSDWTAYTDAFEIEKSDAEQKVIYAKLTDNQNNVAYISTDGFTFDITDPVITVTTDCASATITVSEANIDTVTANGDDITLDGDNKYTFSEIGTYSVIVTDKAGNTATKTFEIKGHDWADATCTEPKTCKRCSATEGEALDHDWADATCTTPKTCKRCSETEGEALGHDWADATCTAPKTCKNCDATDGEALGHDWANATCTTPKTCKRCSTTDGEALDHDWADATCTAPKTCKRCSTTDGEALGHDWADATCTAPKTCKRCSTTDGEALGHDWADATCTAPKTCKNCDATDGEALDHDWADATCTAPKTCKRCSTTDGDALGHDWADATCTTPKTCKRCSTTDGNALDHDWANATCTKPKTCKNCGATVGEALGHNEVKMTEKAATCTETGLTGGKYCSVCHTVITPQTVLPAKGHAWSEWTRETEATCDKAEVLIRTCGNCGVKETKNGAPALGHNDSDGDGNCDHCGGSMGFHCDGNCNCICHKKSFFGKIVRFVYTIISIICHRRITCCPGMEYLIDISKYT